MTEKLEALVNEGDAVVLRKLFDEDAQFQKGCVDNFWDTTYTLSSYINDKHLEENENMVNTCNMILCQIAKEANPKEFLIVLLEQLDTFKDDTKFLTLLDPLCFCLQRHAPLKSRWVLEAAFDVLLAHLKSIELPQGDTLEEEELTLLWIDDKTRRHLSLVNALIDFMNRYLDGPSASELPFDSRNLLMCIILRLFEHPLINLDFISARDKTEEDSRVTATKLFKLSFRLVGCLHNFTVRALQFNAKIKADSIGGDSKVKVEDGESEVEANVRRRPYSDVGLLCIMYMTLVENIHEGHYPSILTPFYNLHLVSSVIHVHFSSPSATLHVHRCALHLLLAAISPVSGNCLSTDTWEVDDYKNTLKDLTNIMTLGSAKEIRHMALNCFDALLRISDPAAKHMMLLIVLKNTTHNGVRSHIIKVIKDMVHLSLCDTIKSDIFLGKSLSHLFKDIFCLPEGVTSDLVQSADWIISSLNFILYLIMADHGDRSLLWSHLNQIDADFLKPTRKGLEISAGHYKQECSNIEKGDVASVDIGGMSLPPLNKEEKQSVMNNALLTLDLIDSIVCRIYEAIDTRKRKQVKS